MELVDLKPMVAGIIAEVLNEALDAKLASLGQSQHQCGGSPDCEGCMAMSQDTEQRFVRQGHREMSGYYHAIPGVADLFQLFQAEQKEIAAHLEEHPEDEGKELLVILPNVAD